MTAAALHADALVWDQHGCLPLRPHAEAVDQPQLYADSPGVDFVSINVGFDPTPALDTLNVLASFRRGVLERPDRFVLAGTAADVRTAKRNGRLAVAFDLEGTELLDGKIHRPRLLRSRRPHDAHRLQPGKSGGGGCHDDPEAGLTCSAAPSSPR